MEDAGTNVPAKCSLVSVKCWWLKAKLHNLLLLLKIIYSVFLNMFAHLYVEAFFVSFVPQFLSKGVVLPLLHQLRKKQKNNVAPLVTNYII